MKVNTEITFNGLIDNIINRKNINRFTKITISTDDFVFNTDYKWALVYIYNINNTDYTIYFDYIDKDLWSMSIKINNVEFEIGLFNSKDIISDNNRLIEHKEFNIVLQCDLKFY